VFDLEISRRQPSMQLVGRPDHASLDLAMLQNRGVRLAGRLVSADGTLVHLDDDLLAHTVASDAKLVSLLRRIDEFVEHRGIARLVNPPEPFTPLWPTVTSPAPERLDLRREGIRTVLWCTGFRRRYPWLRVPVLDVDGEIRHHGGVTVSPGLFVLGYQFQRHRNSAFIDGVGADAAALAHRIARPAPAGRVALAREVGRHACCY
jgi:putative flavoprotein involved in K+ transport